MADAIDGPDFVTRVGRNSLVVCLACPLLASPKQKKQEAQLLLRQLALR